MITVDAEALGFTADTILKMVNAARVRARSTAELALVDAADALLIFDRAGEHSETVAAVLRLEEIATRKDVAELTCEVQGQTGKYVLHRTSGVAPWTTCSCPAFVHRRAGVTDCKHLRAANASAVTPGQPANDAKAPPAGSFKTPGPVFAKASAVDPLAHYRATYLPETIEVFGSRLLKLERLNAGSDHRAFAAMNRALIAEVESWDRSVRANRERAAGAGR